MAQYHAFSGPVQESLFHGVCQTDDADEIELANATMPEADAETDSIKTENREDSTLIGGDADLV